MNMSAQCNDPVHAPQVFVPQANSTPAAQPTNNNIILDQIGVGNEPSNAYVPQPMLVQPMSRYMRGISYTN